MVDAARSRRLVARGAGTGTDEETRAYLQTRLTLYTKLMFSAFVALIVFLIGMFQLYPDSAPPHNRYIFSGAAVLLVAKAVIWRAWLVRKSLSLQALHGIDLTYAIATGAGFACSAVLSYPLRAAAYASLVYGVCTVFTRAIVVPSTGQRTLVISSVLFAPMFAAAIYLGATTTQELRGPAFVASAMLLGGVAIVLATMGSRIIYGLRQQVTQARRLGQYTLVRPIGSGGMGEVFEAHHALLRRPTAVKLMRRDRVGIGDMDRFEREVQLTSRLTHPNTVAVFDYGRDPDGVLYYAMEYLDGIDLHALVKRSGPQPIDRVVSILQQVAGALSEAHEANLIHRDIKPANIILCQRGGVPDVAKVVDFGLVKELAQGVGGTQELALGTPAYLPPEATQGIVGPAWDLYALGAVGYFLLAGRPIFEGDSWKQLVQHATVEPAPLAEVAPRAVPPALDAIIVRLLAKDPAARFPTAAALADALEALPRVGDWTRDDARQFWRELAGQRAAAAVLAAEETRPLAIDLEGRDG